MRSRYGTLSGIVGILCNILLTAAKFIVGSVTGSIAITADAANNLSDAGSSAVTLVSFRLANKPADDEHPFGHGRIEYVCRADSLVYYPAHGRRADPLIGRQNSSPGAAPVQRGGASCADSFDRSQNLDGGF